MNKLGFDFLVLATQFFLTPVKYSLCTASIIFTSYWSIKKIIKIELISLNDTYGDDIKKLCNSFDKKK